MGNTLQEPIGLFRTSLDFGSGWELLGFEGRFLSAVAMHGAQDENIVVLADDPTEVLLSTDGGQSWDSKYVGAPDFHFRQVRLHRDKPEIWHATFVDYSISGGGLITTTDSGETWTTYVRCTGCNVSAFNAIEASNSNPARTVAAFYSGFFQSSLWRTTNAGGSWFVNTSHQYDDRAAIDLTYEEFPSSRTIVLASDAILVWENWIWQGYFDFFGNYGYIGAETPRWDPGKVYVARSTAGSEQPTGGDVIIRRTSDPTVVNPWQVVVDGLCDGAAPSPNNDSRRWQFEAAPEAPVFVLSAPGQPLYRIDVSETVGVHDGGPQVELVDAPWTVVGSPGSHPMLRFDAAPRGEVGLQVVDVRGSQVVRRSVTLGAGSPSLDIRDLVGGRSGVYWIRAVGADERSIAATKVHVIR